MKHELIQKFEALTRIANEHRNIRHKVAIQRQLTHNTFLIDKMYGVAYFETDLNMYCYYRPDTNSEHSYCRIPLSEFSTEDQSYYRELYHPYITIRKEIEDLHEVMKKELIGLSVIRLGNEDEASEDEEVVIDDLNFSDDLCIVIKGKTLDHVLPHGHFK